MSSRGAGRGPESRAKRCFVCGPNNPIGLHIVFRLDDEVCRAEFVPSENHCGWDGVTHGGILYSALDDVMANWIFLQGMRGFTAKCEVRYREELAVGTRVRLEGRMLQRRGRLIQLEGLALRDSDGAVIARSTASFMLAAESPPANGKDPRSVERTG
jgi:acyl-coenzyme A thioesterase PaaI-like protein